MQYWQGICQGRYDDISVDGGTVGQWDGGTVEG